MNLYDLFKLVCSLFVSFFNMRVRWSASIQPTIGQIIVFALATVLIIKFLRGLLE